MKNLLQAKMLPAFILLISVAVPASAQSGNQSPYVFPTFVQATVLQKNGGVAPGVLNYNTFTQEMLFLQNGVKTVLDATNVDTVYLGSVKFIPVGSVYYQKLTDTRVALYKQNFNKPLLAASKAEFDKSGNMNSAMTASQGIVKPKISATDYDLKLPDGYILQAESQYWLQKGKSFYAAGDLKKIIKVFPDKGQAATDFVKTNSLDLHNDTDLIKLVMFCNQ